MWKPIILDVECIVCNKSLQKINHDPREVKLKMGKITCRRSRTPNWSIDEKKYLLELIKERKEAIVTKNNNGPNYSEEKDVAWNEILRKLSQRFGNKFSGSSIKKVKTQWQNMKRIAREEIAIVGSNLEKFTRQSLEVCTILDMVKDGVLKRGDDNLNDTVMTANIEIKTEHLDEDMNDYQGIQQQPSCSGASVRACESLLLTDNTVDATTDNIPLDLSESSTFAPDQNDHEAREELRVGEQPKKDASVMTDGANYNVGSQALFHRELHEFFRFSSDEKQIKMESLKEERCVVKAMRETAELNKIIAEEKLKHVLWLKKRDTSMYSGEPGSGAGKGGGGGGSIREAGGTFGKMEAAREDEYFYKQQKQQLANLKGHLNKEIAFHQEQIKRHEDAIRRHKEQMSDMEKK